MLATSTAASLVLNGTAYSAQMTITLGLPGGVYSDVSLAASNVEITASTLTDVPDSVRYQTGFPQIAGSFTLSGVVDPADPTKTAAWLFGRGSTTSPLFRKDALWSTCTFDVTLGIPTGTEAIRKLTGYIAHYQTNGDSVEFQVVDRAGAMRASLPATPPVVTAAPYNAGLTSEYAIDAVLRAATVKTRLGTVSSWPAAPAGALLAVGLRASLWAETGTLDTTFARYPPVFSPGGYGSALSALTGTTATPVRWALSAPTTSTTVTVQAWVNPSTSGTVNLAVGDINAASDAFVVKVSATNIIVQSYNGGAPTAYTWTTAVGAGTARYVKVAFTQAVGATSWSASITLDAATQATGTVSASARSSGGYAYGLLTPSTSGRSTTEAFFVSAGSAPSLYPFTPTAVLDPSLNTLEVVPGIDAGTDPRQVIQDIAAADLGVAGFDEAGMFRFQNRNTIAAKQSVRTLTSSGSLSSHDEETGIAAVINRAQIGFTGWTMASAYSTQWSLTRPWRIPPHATGRNKVIRFVRLPNVAVNVPSAFTVLPTGGGVSASQNYFAVSLDVNGLNAHPGITVTAQQQSSQLVKLTFSNPTAQAAFLVVPATITGAGYTAGTPFLTIAGQTVTQDNESIADFQYPAEDDGGAASSRMGECIWAYTGSAWIQDADSAQQLAQDVVMASYVPRPNLTNVAVFPDPRLQTTDVVRLTDTDSATPIDEFARIFGYRFTWPPSMTIDGQLVASPGYMVLGVAGRSELGSNAYLGGYSP